jgi:hypothetical protein
MIPELLIATIAWIILIAIIYSLSSWKKIYECYKMFVTKEYWTNYNIVEALSWFSKAIIIVPGLLFNIQLWWMYILTLATSMLLIWASNKKLLPALVGFNTLWVWISCVVLVSQFTKGI